MDKRLNLNKSIPNLHTHYTGIQVMQRDKGRPEVAIMLSQMCSCQIALIMFMFDYYLTFVYYLKSQYSIRELRSILYGLLLPQKHSNYSGNLIVRTIVILNGRNDSIALPQSVLGDIRQLTECLRPVTSLYTTGHGVDSLNQYKFILLGSMLTPIKISSLNYHVILVAQPQFKR